jgi:hypothetical protein
MVKGETKEEWFENSSEAVAYLRTSSATNVGAEGKPEKTRKK